MLNKSLVALLLIIQTFLAGAQPWNIDSISSKAQISLMTTEPGDLAYTVYGHSALRVQDPETGYDYVFNYGTFHFGPDFVPQFIRGKLLYYLNVEPYPYFEHDYVEDRRSIIQQRLLLTPEEDRELFSLLIENAQPENKFYHYDFLKDNCSTRIRDILKKLFGEKLHFTEEKEGRKKITYRRLLDEYLLHDEWTDFGQDLLIGIPVDRRAGAEGKMFLPEHLMTAFAQAVIDGDTTRKLAEEPVYIKKYPRYNTERHPFTTPQVVFWLIFTAYLIWMVRQTNARNISPVFPFIVLTITGIVGWILLFMWFGTDHATTKWNLNILWAFPLSFPLSFFLFKKTLPVWVRRYFHAYRVFLTVVLFLIVLLPQQFHQAVIPIILLQILQLSALLPLPKLDNPAELIN